MIGLPFYKYLRTFNLTGTLEKGYRGREVSHLVFAEVPHNLNIEKSSEMMTSLNINI